MPQTTSQTLTLERLQEAVAGKAAAFRCRSRLQPAGGPGDKVFPPTYAGAIYAVEQRRVSVKRADGNEAVETVTCVLLDSVQSQANRMEEALQDAIDAGQTRIPIIEVDFSDANKQLLKPIDARVTSLTVPHRLADAILRDSVIADDGDDKGKLFCDSSLAERWRKASPANATPIYELCPTALMFGVWGAPEKPGGLGAKFERSIRSEIVGIDIELIGERRGLRSDPLGIVKNASVVLEDDMHWRNASDEDTSPQRPSEINHGPIIFPKSGTPSHGGVTLREAEQIAVLTLAGIRRLRFPPTGETWTPCTEQMERDNAARTVLAALGLCSWWLAFGGAGMNLRSGCDLYRPEEPIWELLDVPGKDTRTFAFANGSAERLLKDAIKAAAELKDKDGKKLEPKWNLKWRCEPIKLKPSDNLIQLILNSQELVKKEGEGS